MNITAYSVIIFFDTCLIRKFHFEAFHSNLVPQKVWTIATVLNVMLAQD